MNNFSNYAKDFFGLLDLGSDKDRLHFYKEYIASASADFLNHATKEKAYEVYSFFLDSYRINISGDRSFIDLLDVLKKYEENAAVLSDKQRDHYIHSVNVFLLGLSIYSQNKNIRDCFEKYLADTNKNIRCFDSTHEEFFFRWGMSSLFHDIGYPVEIVNNQLNKFIGFISGSNNKGKAAAGPFLDYFDFRKLNSIEINDNNIFSLPDYIKENEHSSFADRPTALLSANLSHSLGLDYNMTQKTIGGFLKTMQDYSFVDHGFYSAMILLKWYGEIIQRRGRDNGLFLSHILDAAASIFLHNAYRNVFMREPYSLDALSPSIQPFAYLLILCDEAQEWNREAYGEVTKQLILVDDSKIEIDDNLMKLHYITKKGVLNEEFVIEKTEFINNLLDIVSIFEAGIKVTATTRTEKLIHDLVKSRDNLYPRLLIEYIETIAVKIHEMYIANQISKNPGKLPEYPTWESLPDTLKYSNVRQAKDMVKKLDMVDCYIASGSSDEEVKFFSEEETEFLASYEHRLWVDERLYNGWTFSEVKDISKKQSPYLIGYEELPEDIKDLDRDTIRNILPLLKEVGLKVYRMAADGQN